MTLLVRRLNLDASWHVAVDGVGVMFDPWLVGSEVDLAPWFHEAWHTGPVVDVGTAPATDLVVVSQRWTDHDHPATRAALKHLPVAGVPGVSNAALIPEWGCEPLRNGTLRLWRLSRPLWRPPAYHAIVLLTDDRQAIVHAPHGLPAGPAWALRRGLDAMGASVAVLAISRAGYQLPFWLGGRVNPGPADAERAVAALSPRAVLAIHDEDKREVGLVARLARRTVVGPVAGDLLPDSLGCWHV